MTSIDPATPEDLRAFFKRDGYVVLTFLGYSAAGYENEAAMLEEASRILGEYSPSTTIVNIGATPDGIGAVYELARRNGYVTSGIVSTQMQRDNVAPSPAVDRIFYIEDDTWGGLQPGTSTLSPTSAAMVEYSDVLVAIGGGDIARDEMAAARDAGKEVRYIAAEMNHETAIGKAAKGGRPAPTEFGSPVSTVMRAKRSI